MGRPSSYTQEIADAICVRLMDGESLRAITRDDGMPGQRTVFQWLAANKEFAQQYAHAREIQAENYADEIIEISDDSANDIHTNEDGQEIVNHERIARAKLRVDSRKWVASKLLPKKYGDRTTQVLEGGEKPIEIVDPKADLISRIARLAANAGAGGVSEQPDAPAS